MKKLVSVIVIFLVIYLIAVIALNVLPKAPVFESSPTTQETTTASPSGRVVTEEIVAGTGNATQTGDTVTVHYIGRLENGTQFESSYEGGQPFTFTLGSSEVIKGWDEGIVGMKVGEKRKLTIPPDLGYGAVAQGSIPANSTLIFEVELVSINTKQSEENTPQINL